MQRAQRTSKVVDGRESRLTLHYTAARSLGMVPTKVFAGRLSPAGFSMKLPHRGLGRTPTASSIRSTMPAGSPLSYGVSVLGSSPATTCASVSVVAAYRWPMRSSCRAQERAPRGWEEC